MNDLSIQYNQPIAWLPPLLPGTILADQQASSHEEDQFQHSTSGPLHEGIREVKMHTAATLLMGAGSLLMNFLPGFKMSWPMAVKFAAANMVMMVMIAFGLGAYKATKGETPHQM